MMFLRVAALYAMSVAAGMAQEPAVLDAPVSAQSPDATPIRSQIALDAYLRQNADQSTPFSALPAGARERFFLSLHWGGSGLGSFDPTILADELAQPEIEAVLRLFGDDIVRYAPRSRRSDSPRADVEPTPSGQISDLERRYNDFYRAVRRNDLDERAFSDLLVERFDTLLADAYAPETLRTLDDRHLAMLWNAARLAAMQSNAQRHVTAMQAVFLESGRRTNASPPIYRLRAMRDVLLAAHRFEDARRFLDQYPDVELPTLPAFVDPLEGDAAHTAWVMDADGDRLTRQPIDLSGTRLLITAGCHISQDAAEDITADPVLGPIFARQAHWLMLPPGNEDIEAVHGWNRLFPQAPARMIHSRDEWPIFPNWAMPVFYVVRDGRIVDSLSGWSRGDSSYREALIKMLQDSGLMEPSAVTR